MKQIRLLTSDDIQLLEKFINTNSDIQNSADHLRVWNYYKNFLINNHREVAFSSIIVHNKIQGIILGYTPNARWNKPDLLPIWIGSRLIGEKLSINDKDKMISLLVEYFESLNYSICYAVIVANQTSQINSVSLMNKYIRRAFKNLRYDFTIEKIINQQTDFNSMCKLYKMMCPMNFDQNTKIIIARGVKNKETSNVLSHIK